MTDKSSKFWTFMLLMVLGMSVLVLAIDFSIKGAILEESIKLRREIQSWKVAKDGAKPERRADIPAPANGPDNGTIPGDVLDFKSPGMEAGSSANGAKGPISSASKRRANPRPAKDTKGL